MQYSLLTFSIFLFFFSLFVHYSMFICTPSFHYLFSKLLCKYLLSRFPLMQIIPCYYAHTLSFLFFSVIFRSCYWIIQDSVVREDLLKSAPLHSLLYNSPFINSHTIYNSPYIHSYTIALTFTPLQWPLHSLLYNSPYIHSYTMFLTFTPIQWPLHTLLQWP